MSLYYATKCDSCAAINIEYILNPESMDKELGYYIAPCTDCYEFPKVLYTTDEIDQARAYNEVIALIG